MSVFAVVIPAHCEQEQLPLVVDVVEAVKESRCDEGFTTRLGARAFYALSSWLAGCDLHRSTHFKLLDRRVVDTWHRLAERSLFFHIASERCGAAPASGERQGP